MKKAVSSVVATLLLIVVAVASGTVIYFWVTGYLGLSSPSSTHVGQARLLLDAYATKHYLDWSYMENICNDTNEAGIPDNLDLKQAASRLTEGRLYVRVDLHGVIVRPQAAITST